MGVQIYMFNGKSFKIKEIHDVSEFLEKYCDKNGVLPNKIVTITPQLALNLTSISSIENIKDMYKVSKSDLGL